MSLEAFTESAARAPTFLDELVAPGLRLWMLLAGVSCVFFAMLTIICCVLRIRIPRSKREIELAAAKRAIDQCNVSRRPTVDLSTGVALGSASGDASDRPAVVLNKAGTNAQIRPQKYDDDECVKVKNGAGAKTLAHSAPASANADDTQKTGTAPKLCPQNPVAPWSPNFQKGLVSWSPSFQKSQRTGSGAARSQWSSEQSGSNGTRHSPGAHNL